MKWYECPRVWSTGKAELTTMFTDTEGNILKYRYTMKDDWELELQFSLHGEMEKFKGQIPKWCTGRYGDSLIFSAKSYEEKLDVFIQALSFLVLDKTGCRKYFLVTVPILPAAPCIILQAIIYGFNPRSWEKNKS